MREEEVVSLLAAIAGCVAIALIAGVCQHRGRKLKVIEEALKRGGLDAATQQMLAQELVRPLIGTGWLAALFGGGKLLFAIGWVLLFLGVGLWITGGRYGDQVGPQVVLLGFGVLSLPLVIRELDAKRLVRTRERTEP